MKICHRPSWYTQILLRIDIWERTLHNYAIWFFQIQAISDMTTTTPENFGTSWMKQIKSKQYFDLIWVLRGYQNFLSRFVCQDKGVGWIGNNVNESFRKNGRQNTVSFHKFLLFSWASHAYKGYFVDKKTGFEVANVMSSLMLIQQQLWSRWTDVGRKINLEWK